MDLQTIFDDLLALENVCSDRRLVKASKWCSELLYHISLHPEASTKVKQNDQNAARHDVSLNLTGKMAIRFAHASIDNFEYEQAAHCTKSLKDENALIRFIHYFTRFMAIEKSKIENMADTADRMVQAENDQLISLNADLCRVCSISDDTTTNALASNDGISPDAYMLYLHGIILKELGFKTEAKESFIRSLNMEKLFWPSWQETARLITSKDEISQFPDHWLKTFFMGEAYLSMQLFPEALQVYMGIRSVPGLGDCPYVLTQMAIAHHHLQDVDSVIEAFQTVRDQYPYRLDHVDLLSNSLFVKGMRSDLATLAHSCTEISRYCPETCVVVGNYYSLRGEHDKAVIYFQRALKLDPQKSDAWTLLGHEFMELKNTAAATLSYQKALEIDPNDYRAWYGLGQHYDILKMPSYAMYYYNMAQKVQPQDSRMIIALGEMYEKQSKYEEARKCFWKAHLVGDIEGQALLRLGKLYEKIKNSDQAAASYAMYLAQLTQQGITAPDKQPNCYRFLAEYHLNKNHLDDAHYYAQFCLEYDSTKEEARGILRRISQLRSELNVTEMQVNNA